MRNSPDPRLGSSHPENVSLTGRGHQSQRRVGCCGGERKERGIVERESAWSVGGDWAEVWLMVGRVEFGTWNGCSHGSLA